MLPMTSWISSVTFRSLSQTLLSTSYSHNKVFKLFYVNFYRFFPSMLVPRFIICICSSPHLLNNSNNKLVSYSQISLSSLLRQLYPACSWYLCCQVTHLYKDKLFFCFFVLWMSLKNYVNFSFCASPYAFVSSFLVVVMLSSKTWGDWTGLSCAFWGEHFVDKQNLFTKSSSSGWCFDSVGAVFS